MKRNTSRKAEEAYLAETLRVVRDNVREYGQEVAKMQEDIDEMLEHYHDNDAEVLTILNNTVTMHTHMKRALERNEKALKKPYFGRIVFHDEALNKEESLYIGRGGIAKDTTHQMVTDWRAPVARRNQKWPPAPDRRSRWRSAQSVCRRRSSGSPAV